MLNLQAIRALKDELIAKLHHFVRTKNPEHEILVGDILWFYDYAKNQLNNHHDIDFGDALEVMKQRQLALSYAIEALETLDMTLVTRSLQPVDESVRENMLRILQSLKSNEVKSALATHVEHSVASVMALLPERPHHQHRPKSKAHKRK